MWVELDLDHGTVTPEREADRGADDAGLGQRGVPDAVRAEAVLQALGDAEDAAEPADVLPHEHDLVVRGHGGGESGVEGLRHRQVGRRVGGDLPRARVAAQRVVEELLGRAHAPTPFSWALPSL
jgi:hypothetical protein